MKKLIVVFLIAVMAIAATPKKAEAGAIIMSASYLSGNAGGVLGGLALVAGGLVLHSKVKRKAWKIVAWALVVLDGENSVGDIEALIAKEYSEVTDPVIIREAARFLTKNGKENLNTHVSLTENQMNILESLDDEGEISNEFRDFLMTAN